MFAAALLTAAGCRFPVPDDVLLKSIVVTPATRSLTVGELLTFQVVARTTDGGATDVTELATWRSSDELVVTVSVAGTARGVSAGSAQLSVTYLGSTLTLALSVHRRYGPGNYFGEDEPWRQEIAGPPLHADSDTMISWLDSAGAMTSGLTLDLGSLHVVTADQNTPLAPFAPRAGYYHGDGTPVPAEIPVPPDGALTGSADYTCQGGDCRLLVVDPPNGRIFELWDADASSASVTATIAVRWDLLEEFGDDGRGAGCVSATASGLPLVPLLARYQEVANADVRHALPLMLPSNMIRLQSYVAPATANSFAGTGTVTAPPMGAHFRLKASFDSDALPTTGARALARALQRYGMILTDTSSSAMIAAGSTDFEAGDWTGILGSRDLNGLRMTDFEIVDSGPVHSQPFACTRSGRH